jgi:hypothetical protein
VVHAAGAAQAHVAFGPTAALGVLLRTVVRAAGVIDGVSNQRVHEAQRRIGQQKIDPRQDRS